MKEQGGRKWSSPVYALIEMLYNWYTGTDKVSTIADVILIDYQKVLDVINHNIVLHKFKKMGVPQFRILINGLQPFYSTVLCDDD